MDDVHSSLPNANYNAINNVRLYLRVTYLSEITDASGITILPHALQDSPCSSRSTLQWPHQPPPKPTAWQHWRSAISQLYLRTDSQQLVQPLKEWAGSMFNLDWQWDWRIQPETMELYQRNGSAWSTRQPVLHKRTYVAYKLQEQRRTTFNPELLPPATPSIDSTQTFLIIQLPIFKILHPVTPQPQPSTDLLERLSTPPSAWATPLWHRV